MGIPALVAAGLLEAVTASEDISSDIGWGTILGTVVSGIRRLCHYRLATQVVSSNKFTSFLIYRVILGAVIVVLVLTGAVATS